MSSKGIMYAVTAGILSSLLYDAVIKPELIKKGIIHA